MKLLQGDPVGGKATLKKPLTANAALGADGHYNARGVGQVEEIVKRLSDLLKDCNDCLLDLTSCELGVKPKREGMDAPSTVRPLFEWLDDEEAYPDGRRFGWQTD